MKKLLTIIALTLLSSSIFAQQYKLNSELSSVVWVGKKVTGEHTGKIKIKSGTLDFSGNGLKGANIVMDMTSITNTDLEDEEYNKKLITHLKSDDFFSVAKFPTSTLKVTKVGPADESEYVIYGDLTIKGITKPIVFPVTITEVGNSIKVVGQIIINRTEYEIRYGSGSFFEGLGDKMINDEFELNLDLIANKK